MVFPLASSGIKPILLPLIVMKQKFILSILIRVLVLLLAASVRTERHDNTVPGRIIVQFKPGTEQDISGFIKSHAGVSIKAERCLSSDLKIWPEPDELLKRHA